MAAQSRRRQNRWGEGGLLRHDIITAARTLLEEHGVESAVTFSAVARTVGITAPSIYPHFPHHEALIQAVVTDVNDDIVAALVTALNSVGDNADPRDQIRAVCQAFVHFGSQHPVSFGVLFTRHHPTAVPEVGQITHANHEHLLRLIAAAAPHLTKPQVRRRGVLFWTALHGLAVLPPHHPRFPWPDTNDLTDDLLHLLLADPTHTVSPRPKRPVTAHEETPRTGTTTAVEFVR